MNSRVGLGLRFWAVGTGIGVLVREQLLGHCCLLVRGDVVRPAPHSRGGGSAQLLPHHRTGEDRTVVAQRRGISHSPGSWPGGRCEAGSPGPAGGCRSG
ncbi:hypothetical protein ACFRFL_34360, partial [Streptomyces sp. NPDC056708]|uniref:hypothetical protein n=1 Tax=unclassified Streptomyces TaxID=2593676 RepID=UPI0036837200